jgi:hypothetical protein
MKFPLTNVDLKTVLIDLVTAFQSLPTARKLSSTRGRGTLRSDLLRLELSIESDDFDLEQPNPLLNAVLENEPDEVIWNKVYDAVTESTPPPRPIPSIQQTPWLRNTSSFANSSEHRKYVDDVLKEELGPMHVGIPGFFEAIFEGVTGLEPTAKAVLQKCKQRSDIPQR